MTQSAEQPGGAPKFPTVGRWMMTVLPQGWAMVYGFGIRQMMSDAQTVLANVGLGQDNLETEDGFEAYLDSQAKMIQNTLTDPKIAGPQPTSFPDCDDARMMLVLHTPSGVEALIHVQTYVRIGLWVGIITLTATQEQLRSVRPYSDQFTQGLKVLPEAEPIGVVAPPAAPTQG